MEMEVNAVIMDKNPQYSSSVVKSALFDFYGRSVSIFKSCINLYTKS